ncbi:MAG: flavin reductase family protein, partial [Candidatus Hodarchaeales archaeon]
MKEQLVPSRKTISNFLVPFPSVVTTKNLANVPNAITMSYFSAIHWDPPSVVLSISSKHQSNRNLKENPIFTINVLENDVQSIELANL